MGPLLVVVLVDLVVHWLPFRIAHCVLVDSEQRSCLMPNDAPTSAAPGRLPTAASPISHGSGNRSSVFDRWFHDEDAYVESSAAKPINRYASADAKARRKDTSNFGPRESRQFR
jgi:hypothetical protein